MYEVLKYNNNYFYKTIVIIILKGQMQNLFYLKLDTRYVSLLLQL